MMTNEQKTQVLEYHGYKLIVARNPLRQSSYVVTPDGWMQYVEDIGDIYNADYNAKQLAELINIAWEHFQKTVRSEMVEQIARYARYIDIAHDKNLIAIYNEWHDDNE